MRIRDLDGTKPFPLGKKHTWPKAERKAYELWMGKREVMWRKAMWRHVQRSFPPTCLTR